MENRSKNTRFGILAVVLLVVLIGALLLFWKSSRVQTTQGAKTITVSITHMNGTVKDLTLHTDAEYLLGALNEATLVEGYESAYGYTIETVDGEFADAGQGQWWVFTKGGEWVDTDVSTTPIQDADAFEFSVYVG